MTGARETAPLPRIALTGATGYAGGAFLRHLSGMPSPWPVTALVRHVPSRRLPFVTYVQGELPGRLPAGFPPPGTDVLVHLANENRSSDPDVLHAVNVAGTRTLLGAAPCSLKGVLLGSSLSVYGKGAQIRVTERALPQPYTALARARLGAEREVAESMRRGGGTAFLLRPRFITGRDDASFLPGINRLRQLPLRVRSDRIHFSVIDVEDYGAVIAQLARRAVERAARGTPVRTAVNVAYRRPVALQDLFDLLASPPGSDPTRWLPAAPVRALCSALPGHRAARLSERLDLVTRSHWADVGLLEGEIGTALTAKSPETVVRSYRAYESEQDIS
ncbi:NAD(P)-dependent oxidoreductase [Streptomyces sp. Wb2n-11]|uniref:NAD-dependent epimerase/dehydratase family protein n=1 Tax=Streptomyces sp. Wb2n-11 TaxID=1030533 RepID=UPI000B25E491|nr:NAD(P)-dependent oxidoreductase [Streptomyces sp. Wb2n-11]